MSFPLAVVAALLVTVLLAGTVTAVAAPKVFGALISGKRLMSGGKQYDGLIQRVAAAYRVPPTWLKAIVAVESNFDPYAINPERDFVLGGMSYKASSRRDRIVLVQFILQGNDPATLRLNPSLGLTQLRVSTARKFLPSLRALQLFDEEVNLTIAAQLLAQLIRAGITLETIDAWNVGQDLKPRNLLYRTNVRDFANRFQGDFA